MKESGEVTIMKAPVVPKFERLKTIQKEHKEALERAVSLNIPHSLTAMKESIIEEEKEEEDVIEILSHENASKTTAESSSAAANWDDLVQKLFKKNESGQILFNREALPS